jgi:DNA-binding NarL/FixJ family response regulator
MRPATVLIADDHPIFRRGLRDVLERHPGFEVVAELGDGAAALAALRTLRPRIGVLDIAMPDLDGLEILDHTAGWPDPPALVLLILYDDYVERAMHAGARGYVLKENAEDELVRCLAAVLRGERFLSEGLTWAAAPGQGHGEGDPLAVLTPTERRVLRLLARFKTSREIAEVLCVSPRTVQNHRANMCRKLGLSGAAALLQLALTHAAEPLDHRG